MRIIPNRIKNAIKCLMGKSLQAPTPTVHEYKLFLDDEKRFAGKNVIVTGGTGAIGSAICYQLAACGALVGMCGRNEEKIKSTIAKIANESPCVASKLVPVVLDVNNDEQVESAVDWFVSKYGKLDAFVNNAGGQPGRVGGMSPYLHEQDISQIDLVLDTNLRNDAWLSCCRKTHGAAEKRCHHKYGFSDWHRWKSGNVRLCGSQSGSYWLDKILGN